MKTLIAIAVSIALGQYFWLSDTVDAYAISLNAQLFIAWALVVYFIPYERLLEKSAAFIFMLSYVSDIFAMPIWCNVSVFGTWMLWAAYRSYDVESDEIVPGSIYWVAHKPDKLSGLVLSMLSSKPLGGYGVLCNGIVYLYHHSEFKAVGQLSLPADMVYIKSSLKSTEKIEQYLQNNIGAKWGVFSNCLTVRFRIRNV